MAEKTRHIILINKDFQFKLIIKFLLVNILVMILFGISLYFFLNSELDTNLRTAHVTYKNLKVMLLPVILTLSGLNILVSSIIISVFVLYSSHKIAGPMYRFNAVLSDISEKNLNTFVSVRKDDQMYECSDSLKKLINGLTMDISVMKSKLHDLKNLLEKSGVDVSVSEKIEELEKLVGQYRY
ncbi:MAG TPA: hypothetical protein PK514_11900 [Spirochaetota bacterium]|nr:hypothetical protein [Spirochaetota bacterium]